METQTPNTEKEAAKKVFEIFSAASESRLAELQAIMAPHVKTEGRKVKSPSQIKAERAKARR